jgi:hypothetical protein
MESWHPRAHGVPNLAARACGPLATLVALQVGDLQKPHRERLYGRHAA